MYCFSDDLLCSENSGEALSAGNSPDVSSEFDSPARFDDHDELSIAGFIEDELDSVSSSSSLSASSLIVESSSRSSSVSWILKVRAFYGFQAMTAYLAVNYFDRFLKSHPLPQTSGWPLQLLSVACLSLAAKMEEPLVPSLLDFQVEGAKFIFEPKTIQRMELVVLGALDWRLRAITPFTFISFFASKLDTSGSCTGFLTARSTDIILSHIRESNVLEYRPSSIAAAAILCAASEMPSLSFATPEHAESWCDGMSKDKVSNCYNQMQQFVVDHSKPKSIKVIPQFRVTALIRTRSTWDSSSSSSSNSSPYDKRRRLHENPWEDDDNYGI